MKTQFNLIYFIVFLILLLSEIVIAKYATGFTRHTFGDYLCVIVIYSFIKSILKVDKIRVALFVLLLSYTIEFLQLTNLQDWYPLAYKNLLQLILGTSFSIADLVAYTLGIITTLIIEKKLNTNEK